MQKRQTGTKEETIELQCQIKNLLKQLKWSRNRFARIVFTELNDFDDQQEILKFQETIKKELQRETTKIERLHQYLDIIFRHKDAEKIDLIFNKPSSTSIITGKNSIDMIKISKDIDRIINN